MPTATEQGLKFEATGWIAMFAPKGTPKPVVWSSLNAAARAALRDEAVRKRLLDLGNELPTAANQTPEALGAFVVSEIDKWVPVIKSRGHDRAISGRRAASMCQLSVMWQPLLLEQGCRAGSAAGIAPSFFDLAPAGASVVIQMSVTAFERSRLVSGKARDAARAEFDRDLRAQRRDVRSSSFAIRASMTGTSAAKAATKSPLGVGPSLVAAGAAGETRGLVRDQRMTALERDGALGAAFEDGPRPNSRGLPGSLRCEAVSP